ncbi:hypothetical protein Tco_1510806, partial [Tanacetum coccineum]
TSVGVKTEGATTTTFGLDAGLDSGNIFESLLRSYDAPILEGHTSGSAEDSLKLQELSVLVPKLESKIDSLEKELTVTKQTLGNDVLMLVKKVKTLEVALKRKTRKVGLSESEDEETENQRRKIQDIDDDPLVSLVRDYMEEKEVSASGEAQEEYISPTVFEAAQTLSHVTSQSVSTYKRRVRSADMGKDIGTSLNFFSAEKERLNSVKVEVNTGREEVNPGSAGVNTGSTPVSTPSLVQTVNVTIPSPVKEEDWDTIRSKLEANAELTKSLQRENMPSDDFAKRIVDIINQKNKYYAEQNAKAKRDKPMTQAQQRDYMSTFIKNQSSWKKTQLKKLTFEEHVN